MTGISDKLVALLLWALVPSLLQIPSSSLTSYPMQSICILRACSEWGALEAASHMYVGFFIDGRQDALGHEGAILVPAALSSYVDEQVN